MTVNGGEKGIALTPQSSSALLEGGRQTLAQMPQWAPTSEIAMQQPAELRTLTRGAIPREEEC